MQRIFFGALFLLSLVEIVYFYCAKIQNDNPEIEMKTQKPRASQKFVRGFGFCTILCTVGAIIGGFRAFPEQSCLDNWFVEDEHICKSCTLHFGQECISCSSSDKCDTCQSGYFFATEDDPAHGIVASTEIRCRACQSFFGEHCLECDQKQCTKTDEANAFIHAQSGAVIDCESVPNCKPGSCTADGCGECVDGFFLNNQKQCDPCSKTLTNCATCSSAT